MIHRLQVAFEAHFAGLPHLIVQAPGRVNLIGEHTDYNQGYVFPAAIDRLIRIAARPRPDSLVRMFSLDFEQESTFSLEAIEKVTGDGLWSNYLRGVVVELQRAGHSLQGFDAVLMGDVPQGAGLSSSAALEVATATLLNQMFKLSLSKVELALLAQRAENEFVGVACGVMDQFISALGEPDHALFIDCRSLAYRPVPLRLDEHGAAIVIVNSGIKRGLVDSEFNARRAQCHDAVLELSKLLKTPLQSLRDVEMTAFQGVADRLPPLLAKRVRHVLSENQRVLQGVEALEEGDLEQFGQLMNMSHASLRDDYEVSTTQLDRLVALSQQCQGVFGSRLTGAGFGGCTVSLVANAAIETLRFEVLQAYEKETGLTPSMLVSKAHGGASLTT